MRQLWRLGLFVGLMLSVAACYRGDNTGALTPVVAPTAKPTEAPSTSRPPVVVAPPAVVVVSPPTSPAPPPPSSPGITTVDGDKKLAEVEAVYKVWVAFEITAVAQGFSEFKAQAKQLNDRKSAVEDKLLELELLGVLYAIAAKVRHGDVQYGFALKLGNVPIPQFILNNPGAIPMYQHQLDINVVQFVNEAKKDWADALEMAKQANISNRWSDLALAHLNTVFPAVLPP